MRFEGNFSGEYMGAVVFLRGTMVGNQLAGQFQAPADANISGLLSPDGSQIKGWIKVSYWYELSLN